MAEVSIIIRVWNSEDCIEACMESIVAQRMEGLETIIVDDGSTDSTPDIAARFAERHENMRVFACRHAGPGAATNTGFEHMTAPYATVLDADDELTPWAIPALLETARRYKADIVYGRQGRLDGLGMLEPILYLEPFIRTGFNLRNDHRAPVGFPVVNGKLYHTDLIRKKGCIYPPIFDGETVFSVSAWFASRMIAATEQFVYVRRPVPRSPGHRPLAWVRSLFMVENSLSCVRLVVLFCGEHDLPEVRSHVLEAGLSRIIGMIAEMPDLAEKRKALEMLVHTVDEVLQPGEDLERYVGFTYQELSSMPVEDLTEARSLHRRVRGGLIREWEAAGSIGEKLKGGVTP